MLQMTQTFFLFSIHNKLNNYHGLEYLTDVCKADKEDVDNVISDVLGKTKENLFFEEASSLSMDHAMGVSFCKGWIVVTDVQGRVTFHDGYPKELSKKYLVKTFWMSEGMIFRAYENGNLVKEVKGIEEVGNILLTTEFNRKTNGARQE
jgi:hypothetical protein